MANHNGLMRFICTATHGTRRCVRTRRHCAGRLELLNELGNRLDVRGRHRASGVVHEDIEAAVRIDDPLHKGAIALWSPDHTATARTLYSTRQGSAPGRPGSSDREHPRPSRRRAALAGDADPTPRLVPVTIATLPSSEPIRPPNDELFYTWLLYGYCVHRQRRHLLPTGVLGRASPSTE